MQIGIEQLYELFLKSSGVSTDSREIVPGSIFFALKGETFDGNKFARESLERGAAYAIIDDPTLINNRLILVENVLKTLQELAAHHRKILDIPIISLTGTNGKTTTKELITSVLATKYKVGSTFGNLNNHIGVPLTLLKMDSSTEVGVVEMGASAPGEISLLCSIARPDYGLITNIGKAHLLGFGSIEGVIKSKGELYDFLEQSSGTALYNKDNQYLCDMIAQRELLKAIPYGLSEQYATIQESTSHNPFLTIVLGTDRVIKTHLIGRYNTDNLLAALAVGELMDCDFELSAKAIEDYNPTNNRSQLIDGKRNRLIVDAYNANPTSMKISLESFKKLGCNNAGLILGDMLELGEESQKEHKAILELIKEFDDPLIFLVGEEFRKATANEAYYKERVKNMLVFKNSVELKAYLEKEQPRNMTFLIKGSRGIELEKVIEVL